VHKPHHRDKVADLGGVGICTVFQKSRPHLVCAIIFLDNIWLRTIAIKPVYYFPSQLSYAHYQQLVA